MYNYLLFIHILSSCRNSVARCGFFDKVHRNGSNGEKPVGK